ncbi:MAG: hypothetical protein JSS76_03180 [Bacteroidetes bacterium]|nr:hypothetical protein [Bacteroidota bacterium]
MKGIGLILLLCCAFECCIAQDAGRVILVRVVEFYGVGGIKSLINVVSSSGSETIELEKTRRMDGPEQIENDKKVQATLNDIEGKGYALKTSSVNGVGPDNSVITTTYILEKK